MDSIRHIPCIAVQGRLDFVTPVRTAYDLHCAWPEMELRVVPVSSAEDGSQPLEPQLNCRPKDFIAGTAALPTWALSLKLRSMDQAVTQYLCAQL